MGGGGVGLLHDTRSYELTCQDLCTQMLGMAEKGVLLIHTYLLSPQTAALLIIMKPAYSFSRLGFIAILIQFAILPSAITCTCD